MQFTETTIPGAFMIEIEPRADERGFFARTACVEEFERHGLNGRFVQQSVSWNPRRHTLRGLHYQAAPWEEEKLVRVTRGAIYDVLVDLRGSSPAFGRWCSFELTADNRRQIYIPKGVAHGFQTLADETEVLYEMTVPHNPRAPRGVRWDDPAFGIEWPPAVRILSERDRGYPDFRP